MEIPESEAIDGVESGTGPPDPITVAGRGEEVAGLAYGKGEDPGRVGFSGDSRKNPESTERWSKGDLGARRLKEESASKEDSASKEI